MGSFDDTIHVLSQKRRYTLIGHFVHHRAENLDRTAHGCEWCVHRAMGEKLVLYSNGSEEKDYFIRSTDPDPV
jgi:hypothetical protein